MSIKKTLASATRKKKHPEFWKNGKNFPRKSWLKGGVPQSPFKKESTEEKLVKRKGPRSSFKREEFEKFPETPIEIKMIAAAPFFHVFNKKGVELFSVSLKNVEKTLRFKQRTDPVIKLPPKFHNFFELFSEKKANKLPPHRFYDYKINFIKKNQDMVFCTQCSKKSSKSWKNSSTKI